MINQSWNYSKRKIVRFQTITLYKVLCCLVSSLIFSICWLLVCEVVLDACFLMTIQPLYNILAGLTPSPLSRCLERPVAPMLRVLIQAKRIEEKNKHQRDIYTEERVRYGGHKLDEHWARVISAIFQDGGQKYGIRTNPPKYFFIIDETMACDLSFHVILIQLRESK